MKKDDRTIQQDNEMRLGTSRIRGAGKGVFSTKTYKQGDILGEWKSIIEPIGIPIRKKNDDYSLCIKDKYLSYPTNNNIFKYANDIINIKSSLEKEGVVTYSLLEHNIDWKTEIDPNINDENYRSCIKVYIIAIEDINIGDELYIDYGFDYWRVRLFGKHPQYELVNGKEDFFHGKMKNVRKKDLSLALEDSLEGKQKYIHDRFRDMLRIERNPCYCEFACSLYA